jgi:glutaredoxin
MSQPLPLVTLYSRQNCHLCDVAKERVTDVRSRVRFNLETIDIDTSEDLKERYGERIPVLLVNGEELFAFRVNATVLERKLSKEAPSPWTRVQRWLTNLGSTTGSE